MMTPFCCAADGILHPVRSATASTAAMIDGRIPLPSSALRLTRIRVLSHQRRGSVTVARYTFYNVATGRCGFLATQEESPVLLVRETGGERLRWRGRLTRSSSARVLTGLRRQSGWPKLGGRWR